MRRDTETIGTTYFDVPIRLTPRQMDAIVVASLQTELHQRGLDPTVAVAIKTLLAWYSPDEAFTTADWRKEVQ